MWEGTLLALFWSCVLSTVIKRALLYIPLATNNSQPVQMARSWGEGEMDM